MNTLDTNTQFVQTPEIREHLRLQQQHNAGRHYVARHSTENPPRPVLPLPDHVRTTILAAVPRAARPVEVGLARVAVPLPPRPAVPVLETLEPVAEVTCGLLERILKRLRGSR